MPTDRRDAAAVASAKERRLLGEDQVFLLLSILIGVFAGLAVVCFRMAIDAARWIFFGSGLVPPRERVVLVPGAVGLVVAFLVVRFFPRVRGSGVNQTKAALYIYDGYIPFSTVIGKVHHLGAGHRQRTVAGAGRSVAADRRRPGLGAGTPAASSRARTLRLIAPVGAAAGLAAAFNAPITAVLFVIEEVIGRWSAGVLGAVVLAAVSSVVVERWFLGAEPLFRVPGYHLESPGELAAYAILGVVGGLASLVFVKSIAVLRPRLKALPRWTHYLQPAVAGLLIGLIGRRFPAGDGRRLRVHGPGHARPVHLAGPGDPGGLKILATVLSFSSGTPGGLFAPTLFMGAMLGGAVGGVERLLFPHFTGPLGAYALVGMGALFAGILRAPMTSVFMVLEVSGNYSIILPVIISNTIAYLISRSLQPAPIFDLLSRQDGLDLPSLEEERELAVLRVEDAMHAPTPQTGAEPGGAALAGSGGEPARRVLPGRRTARALGRSQQRRSCSTGVGPGLRRRGRRIRRSFLISIPTIRWMSPCDSMGRVAAAAGRAPRRRQQAGRRGLAGRHPRAYRNRGPALHELAEPAD